MNATSLFTGDEALADADPDADPDAAEIPPGVATAEAVPPEEPAETATDPPTPVADDVAATSPTGSAGVGRFAPRKIIRSPLRFEHGDRETIGGGGWPASMPASATGGSSACGTDPHAATRNAVTSNVRTIRPCLSARPKPDPFTPWARWWLLRPRTTRRTG